MERGAFEVSRSVGHGYRRGNQNFRRRRAGAIVARRAEFWQVVQAGPRADLAARGGGIDRAHHIRRGDVAPLIFLMGWFKKKPDPLSDRARALSDEIAALEAQIKRLDAQAHAAPPPPPLRSTA